MNPVSLAVTNRTAMVVLAVVISVGGLLAYVSLPKESQPQIEFATLVVTTVYPGASPDDIESIVTQEIEREVATISGIDNLRSTSTEGVSSIVVEFLPDEDITEAGQKVREAVDRAKADFPADVEDPMVNDIDFADVPVLTVNLLTSGSLTALRRTAEDLQDELEGVPGVNGVDLLGGLEREVQVDVDLARMQGLGLTINDVVQAVQGENSNIPGGSVDVGPASYLVRVNGEFEDPNEIADLVVKAPDGTPIYVRDLAEVRFGYKDRASYARLNVLQRNDASGKLEAVANPEDLQVIRLGVKKASGENIIEVVDRAEAVIDGFALPSGTEVILTGDQSDEVETLVEDLENNIIAGILFVIAVLLFFLGVRNASIVGLAIPLSMLLSFLTFQVMGQSLNFIILFSLIIALGMLVDNAIVIVENIYRFRVEGHGRWEAARMGAAEVALPVATSTLTTVAAFAPMLFWPGIIGKFMSYMPLTLIITLTASLFVALFLTPVITGFLLRLDTDPVKPVSLRMKQIGVGLVALTALIVGIARWQTLVFLLVAVPAAWALYRFWLRGVTERFQNETVPRLVEGYRAFLRWMLQRDYSVPRAMLRNTAALGAFTAGFALVVAGGLIQAAAAPAGYVLLVPGALLIALGAVGFIVHALESAYLGGRVSVTGGLIFGAVVAALAVLLVVAGRIDMGSVEGVEVLVGMLLLPGVVVIAGVIGMLRGTGGKTTDFGSPYLILTDNRARLLTGTMGLLFGVIGLFFVAPTGVEFFPTTDPNYIQITAEAPVGTTIDRSNGVADDVYGRVMALVTGDAATAANTENVATSVGVGGDAMFGGGGASAERSSVTMNLVDYADRDESTSETLKRIRERLAGLPGVDLQVTQDQGGPPTGAAVNIEVSGRAFAEIERLSNGLKATLTEASRAGRIDGLVDVRDNLNSGRPEYQVRIDRTRAAAFGLTTRDVALAVRGAVNGVDASTYRDGKDEYDITVRMQPGDRASVTQIEQLTVTKDGRTIPLTAVASIVPATGLGSVTRLDQERVVTVMGDAAPGTNANDLLAQVQAELAPQVEERARGLLGDVHRRERGPERELLVPHDGAPARHRAHHAGAHRAVQLAQEPVHHHGRGRAEPHRRAARAHPHAHALRPDDVHRRDLAGRHRGQQRDRARGLHRAAPPRGRGQAGRRRRRRRDAPPAGHPDGAHDGHRAHPAHVRPQRGLRRADRGPRPGLLGRQPEHAVLGADGHGDHLGPDVRDVPHARHRAGDVLRLRQRRDAPRAGRGRGARARRRRRRGRRARRRGAAGAGLTEGRGRICPRPVTVSSRSTVFSAPACVGTRGPS